MVHKEISLNVRLSLAEKKLLRRVARHLHRNMSDTLRVLVFEKAVDLALIRPRKKEFDDTDDPIQTKR